MIVDEIMHSDILNYTKLAFNSLKMIQNDTVYQPIKQGMIDLYEDHKNEATNCGI